ncbi:hypothetical protein BLL37_08685 [Pseudomonas azotoformans]|uniref:Secreted protein n=1 Tax=Pseudomonas azotoformans TaxID=47878 RepID=A0A1V2JQN3_PSEAZ|nr:hypothetical protein [Pseudomonas azotoformans]OIN47030.1 hypothetical protein BFL39_18020 [Pseudomonas azotoformans]ONH46931.1 hypothetical protein BLL37_08685 [Pseudomonas azotoformans]SDM84720.1 hypothetical protein SAMN04489799_0389 [Pseudomonas azotoformans]
MKLASNLMIAFVLTLPVLAQASDGAEALQRFHERTKALFDKHAADLEKDKQKAQQKAQQEQTAPAEAQRQNDQ